MAVGGSYENDADYPEAVPYVATDNFKLIKLAYDHLIEAGLFRFALFSVPESPSNRWAQEREKAFCTLIKRDRMDLQIYRGQITTAPSWDSAVENLVQWLHSIPKPVGIIAVTDARARCKPA